MLEYKSLKDEALSKIKAAQTLDELESVRLFILGKKGLLSQAMQSLGKMSPEDRSAAGSVLNQIKEDVLLAFSAVKQHLEEAALSIKLQAEVLDMSLSPAPEETGTLHPLSHTIEAVTAYFLGQGFSVEEGPDIENDFNNFTALNIPANHPARQEHDTFYTKGLIDGSPGVLRTHTSPVQVRTMRHQKPPIRMIVTGRTFRSDYDATHTPMFHQIEGLVIEEGIHMGHLKQCLKDFLEDFFGVSQLPMRFRSSFFPFTEPSVEVDIACHKHENSLKIGGGDSWLEILGAGMVHPHVLKNVGLDPDQYQGFAFGMGLERLTMLKHGIPDLRAFYESYKRWLKNYGFDALQLSSLLLKGNVL